MNAITAPNPYAWPAAPPVLAGKAWDDLFVWAHRCEMSDLHVQTTAYAGGGMTGAEYAATRR